MKIPMMAELPYKVVKDVSGVLYGPQFFAAEEVVRNRQQTFVTEGAEGHCRQAHAAEDDVVANGVGED